MLHKLELDSQLKYFEETSHGGSYFWMLRFHLGRHHLRRRKKLKHYEKRKYEATYTYIKEEINRRFMKPLELIKLLDSKIELNTRG